MLSKKQIEEMAIATKSVHLVVNSTEIQMMSSAIIDANEFDAVIIIDSDKYFSTDTDRRIMYVASTRALHKLSVVSIGKESEFIKEIKE